MLRIVALTTFLIFSNHAFSEKPYNPKCDYKDISNKCVSIDDGLYTVADERLNRLFDEVSVSLKKLDELEPRNTYYKPFLKSQKTWLRYRDDFCAFNSELSVQSISDNSPMEDNKSCMARLSDERSNQLLLISKKYKDYL